jgi:hypothetical protein
MFPEHLGMEGSFSHLPLGNRSAYKKQKFISAITCFYITFDKVVSSA